MLRPPRSASSPKQSNWNPTSCQRKQYEFKKEAVVSQVKQLLASTFQCLEIN